MELISEIDYKILALERRETLSKQEEKRLVNLREQKEHHVSSGTDIIKTVKVPCDWIYKELPVKTSFDKPPKKKEAFANAFLQFQKEKKALLKKDNPEAKLKLKEIVHEWNFLVSDSMKENYRKLAQEEKSHLGDSFRKTLKGRGVEASEEEKKQKRSDRNNKYQLNVKRKKEKETKDKELCEVKFKEMLEKKNGQLCEIVKSNEALEKDLTAVKLENSVATKMIEEKSLEIEKLKDQYRVLYKMHKGCK